jgi:glycosyltransferase involved in cell wall biosynthesis
MRRAVLHIDTETTWRGGENQLRLLLEHAQTEEWAWHLAAPPDSEAAKRLAPVASIVPVRMRGLAIVSAARQLARYVRKHRIALIDCQSSRAHNLGLFVKLLVPDVCLVVHRRVDYPPGSSWVNRLKYLSPRIDRYVCISGAIAQVLSHYGVPEERLAIVRSAVDPTPFRQLDRNALAHHWRNEWQVPAEVPIIGNVAFLTEQKNHETLIRSLGLLRAKGLQFFCYIAGEGELRPAMEQLALTLGLGPGQLRFLGVRRDVPALLAAADIFALSSQDEGLGTSLLDATYAGCALVATAVGGIPEIVIDGQTGLLAPPRDPERFAAQLERLLTQTDLRQDG